MSKKFSMKSFITNSCGLNGILEEREKSEVKGKKVDMTMVVAVAVVHFLGRDLQKTH